MTEAFNGKAAQGLQKLQLQEAAQLMSFNREIGEHVSQPLTRRDECCAINFFQVKPFALRNTNARSVSML
jgi:hypothetical protein